MLLLGWVLAFVMDLHTKQELGAGILPGSAGQRLRCAKSLTQKRALAVTTRTLAAAAGLLLAPAIAAQGSLPRVTARWVLERPPAATQTQKTIEDRGGINPCDTPDPGFGAYLKWDRAPSMGQMIVPRHLPRRASFDVVFHFHGHEAARKEWVRAIDGPVLVGIDLGNGSGPYDSAFSAGYVFEELLSSVEVAVAKRLGIKQATARFVGLSAWSAGYGAIGRILAQPLGKSRVDSVILLDGLHSGYDKTGGTLNAQQLGPFAEFAQLAAGRKRFMFVSHSSIIPPGYASTTETSAYLVASIGGKPRASKPRGSDPMGLDLIRWYAQGNFHMRGFAGNDKMDHCAHFGVYRDVLRTHLKRRWRLR